MRRIDKAMNLLDTNNSERRSKSKRYNDPVHKRPVNERIVKRKYQINYY